MFLVHKRQGWMENGKRRESLTTRVCHCVVCSHSQQQDGSKGSGDEKSKPIRSILSHEVSPFVKVTFATILDNNRGEICEPLHTWNRDYFDGNNKEPL